MPNAKRNGQAHFLLTLASFFLLAYNICVADVALDRTTSSDAINCSVYCSTVKPRERSTSLHVASSMIFGPINHLETENGGGTAQKQRRNTTNVLSSNRAASDLSTES